MALLFPEIEKIKRNADDLIKRYEAGERDFRGVYLNGVKTLQNINLSGADLRDANLGSVDLRAANLSGANLENANLSSAELSQANLSGTNLTGTVLTDARLIRANLTNAILTNADLTDANFSGCIMPDGIPDPAYDRVINAIGHLKRSAWQPIIKEGDGDLRSSKFGGKPWLSAGEHWPCCPNCDNPMRFFFQLNLQEIPAALDEKFGRGILQLFYCTNHVYIERDRPTDSTFIRFDNFLEGTVRYIEYIGCGNECFLVRIVQSHGRPAEFEIPQTGESTSKLCEGEFPPRLIVGWQEVDDYPDSYEIEIQGISISWDDFDFFDDIGMYHRGDKLAGWPVWVQSEEYPDCPICHQEMKQLIFQLDSDDNIPFLWGDAGRGYILQCPNHQEEVAFLWQCS
ncbi:MAG: pentapeptide repeat-containing protein [Oscillatoriaceae cyanobacterium Prado104]|jgi:uncharacterized protein YwqG|nr:pentapeptide repeat-containing protein [Oscillatoriaceae cyanobacterium Prado104]